MPDYTFKIEENVPIPEIHRNHQVTAGNNWSTRLGRIRTIPGVPCRIVSGLADHYDEKTGRLKTTAFKRARYLKSNIARTLRTHDDYEKWELVLRRMPDETYSLWATYHGRMTEQEHTFDLVRREKEAARFRANTLRGDVNRRFPQNGRLGR